MKNHFVKHHTAANKALAQKLVRLHLPQFLNYGIHATAHHHAVMIIDEKPAREARKILRETGVMPMLPSYPQPGTVIVREFDDGFRAYIFHDPEYTNRVRRLSIESEGGPAGIQFDVLKREADDIVLLPKPANLRAPTNLLLQSGGHFDHEYPELSEYTIEDIALALANQCRFLGHTRTPYSVAQHCVRVSYAVPAENALAALMHDASEAFLGDVPSPLKQLLPDYRALEQRVEADIAYRFGFTPNPETVKPADKAAFIEEHKQFFLNEQVFEVLDADKSRQSFLARFNELTRGSMAA